MKSLNIASARTTHLPLTFSHPESCCIQTKPGSIVQSEEQPSPLTVLPSSQASPSNIPSPQRDLQAPWVQSGSDWQRDPQPSNGVVLPSSQLSAPSTMPSPQTVREQTLGLPLHLKPISTLQVDAQPSPSLKLPSSQGSGNVTVPSPQRATRWQG